MTIAPWSFGIDRASLEEEVVTLCATVMTQAVDPALTREKITIVDQGAGGPMSARPCISILISSPVGSPSALSVNERYWPANEQWLIQFTASTDGDYTVTVLGVDYTVTAVGLSITELRDAMLTEMGLSLQWATTSSGADSIQLDSTELSLLLVVSTDPDSILASRTILNYSKRGLTPALLQVNIECWGLMSIEAPSSRQSGPTMAENLRAAFMDADLNQPMRVCGFVPNNVRVLDGPEVINQQTNSSATCQLVVKATSRMDVQVASGTEINTEVQEA